MLKTGFGGGFTGDRQFEGSSHMQSYRHIEGVTRSASPLKEAFNQACLDEMIAEYSGFRIHVRVRPAPRTADPRERKLGDYPTVQV
jgi:hypothetical protein